MGLVVPPDLAAERSRHRPPNTCITPPDNIFTDDKHEWGAQADLATTSTASVSFRIVRKTSTVQRLFSGKNNLIDFDGKINPPPGAMDLASEKGHTIVHDWWKRSGLELMYTARAIDCASARNGFGRRWVTLVSMAG
ncbi:hypothetical protein BJ742DRAFT_853812 [Cladochytrium replicatum]|nr:hypothetical protein BJ742DRAFT_853812 [Cladochytrium replicatum]